VNEETKTNNDMKREKLRERSISMWVQKEKGAEVVLHVKERGQIQETIPTQEY
jgi:hypothetical protein